MSVRLHVFFSGRVQGVGFRYTASAIAARHANLTGWVKNLADGRVELVAEGDQQDLAAFLSEIRATLKPRATHEEWQDATGEFTRFEIAH